MGREHDRQPHDTSPSMRRSAATQLSLHWGRHDMDADEMVCFVFAVEEEFEANLTWRWRGIVL